MTPIALSASSPPPNAEPPESRDSMRRLRRMAWVCAALVLAITTLSAWLRLTKAGIGCTDWPACYGAVWASAAPALPASAEPSATVLAVRLTHRVLALAALVLIVVMLGSAWPPRRHGWRPALETALGGLASASGSLLACDGIGDCWAKAQGSPAWSALNPWHTPVPGGSAGVHWTHRLGGWAVLLLAAPLAWRLRAHDGYGAAALLAALALQAVLGPLMASAAYPMALVLAHNALAALMLALPARWL